MTQDRLLIPLSLLLCLPMSAVAQSQGAAAANSWIAPLASDGHPDLQGTWRNKSATPLERPKQLEGRSFLTDAEVTELQKRATRIFKDGRSDNAMGDAVFLAALANEDTYRTPGGGSSSPHRSW
jgi:hypothetical protein